MTKKRPEEISQPSNINETERKRILEENIRLHRDTAKYYDKMHSHTRNSFEQYLQRKDIAYIMKTAKIANDYVRVLEIGCGTGNLTMQFLAHDCFLTGVDISAEMIDVLGGKLERQGIAPDRVQLIVTDIDSFISKPSLDKYNIVAMSSVAHHIPDYLAMIEDLGKRIFPNGFMYLIHEPVHKQELFIGHLGIRRAASLLPRAINRVSLLKKKAGTNPTIDWNEQETNFVDYHEHRTGISLSLISERLRPLGFVLGKNIHYNGYASSLASWIDNAWLGFARYEQFKRTYFEAIFQRTKA